MSKWLSLLIIVPCAISVFLSPLWDERWDNYSSPYLRLVFRPTMVLLILGVACLWWPDILVHIHQDESHPLWVPEGFIRAMGWVFLILAVVARIMAARLGY